MTATASSASRAATDIAAMRRQARLVLAEAAREFGLERTTARRWAKQLTALAGAANFPARAAPGRQAAGEPAPAAAARLQAIDTPVEIAA